MKIGLLCNTRDERFSFNMAYFNFAQSWGNVTLISPRQDYVHDDLDLLILPGGEDVLSVRYNEPPSQMCGMPNMDFEYFDLAVLPKYFANKTPIVGICRGLQTLNVAFDGSLHQHTYEPTSTSSRWEHAHEAITTVGNKRFGINSLHHQAIKDLGEGFEPTLIGVYKSKKDGDKKLHIEAIKHKELPIVAFQFHPEELFDDVYSEQATAWFSEEISSILRA